MFVMLVERATLGMATRNEPCLTVNVRTSRRKVLTSNGRTTEDITTTNGKDHIECTPRFLHGAVYRLVTVTGGWWPCYTLDDVEGAERGALV